jgi:hypothetical protein
MLKPGSGYYLLMPDTNSFFTPLEHAVLNAIYEMHLADRPALEAQLLTATVRSRENTGAGFFTRFDVDRASSSAIKGERLRNGPEATMDGLQHGMGFILWLKEGYAECLEGYATAGSTVGIDLERTSFEIMPY